MQGETIFFFFFNHSERLSRWPSKQGVLVLMFPCQTAGLQIDLYCTPSKHPAMNPLLSFCASLTSAHTTFSLQSVLNHFLQRTRAAAPFACKAVTNHVRPLWSNSSCTLLCFSLLITSPPSPLPPPRSSSTTMMLLIRSRELPVIKAQMAFYHT